MRQTVRYDVKHMQAANLAPSAPTLSEQAARLERRLHGANLENRRLAGQVAGLRAEVVQLRSLLTPDIAGGEQVHVWIAGHGDRRFVGYRHQGKVYVPGMRVIEDADILRTEPAGPSL